MSESTVVRIDKNLITAIDKAVEEITDQYGSKKFRNRREFIDEAVKDALNRTVEVIAE